MTTLPVICGASISGVNLTCINRNITKEEYQSLNISVMSEEYFKNLTSDNPQLAQLVCQDILNRTTK